MKHRPSCEELARSQAAPADHLLQPLSGAPELLVLPPLTWLGGGGKMLTESI